MYFQDMTTNIGVIFVLAMCFRSVNNGRTIYYIVLIITGQGKPDGHSRVSIRCDHYYHRRVSEGKYDECIGLFEEFVGTALCLKIGDFENVELIKERIVGIRTAMRLPNADEIN
jgi:hypothetical protein